MFNLKPLFERGCDLKILKAIAYALLITVIAEALVFMLAKGQASRTVMVGCGLAIFLLAFVAEMLGGRKSKDCIEMDFRWKELNREGRCGRCKQSFTEENPDLRFGMCKGCWVRYNLGRDKP